MNAKHSLSLIHTLNGVLFARGKIRSFVIISRLHDVPVL